MKLFFVTIGYNISFYPLFVPQMLGGGKIEYLLMLSKKTENLISTVFQFIIWSLCNLKFLFSAT